MGSLSELAAGHPDARISGGPDIVMIPGLVNAHHHVGLTPFQLGSADHPLELWFASRLALRDVDLHLDTLFSAFEMISSGVTTVQHLHSRTAGDVPQVMAAAHSIIDAYRRIGMRASYSFALRDQNRLVYEADEDFLNRLPSELRATLAAHLARFALPLSDQIAVFRQLRAQVEGDPLIDIQIAPSNLHWLSDAALFSAAALADETGAPMHMHLLETPYQRTYAYKRTGQSAMSYIDSLGLTGPNLTIGHGVWMTDEDIEICHHSGSHICHNCSSNFRLKSGMAPLNRFLDAGIPVAIGIDEAGINDDRDMFQEMRMILNVHREPGIDAPAPAAATVLRMATEHGAATTPFRGKIGRIDIGMSADLVLLDHNLLTYPYQDKETDLVDLIIHRGRSKAIDTVVIGGETVLHKGKFMRVDQGSIMEEIAASLRKPVSPVEAARVEMAREVFPHVKRFYENYLDGSITSPFTAYNSRL